MKVPNVILPKEALNVYSEAREELSVPLSKKLGNPVVIS